ncbi:unnamed protein product [Leptidea sinapis]|uniref:Endonuclease/exonuclease/phosphatase domain-containing protein n=1 Tax=Leptidea sinapis TaxID=189913 RepID=A0A5E4Q5A2_9NEOP|nr:unnamed protein product [Leptidea sinapis]
MFENRSLNTGTDELVISLSKYEPDILALNETWIKEGEEALVPSVTNYRFFQKARTSQRRGEGVGWSKG